VRTDGSFGDLAASINEPSSRKRDVDPYEAFTQVKSCISGRSSGSETNSASIKINGDLQKMVPRCLLSGRASLWRAGVRTSPLVVCLQGASWVFRYLYHFDKGNQQVTTTVLQGLLELISTEVSNEATMQDPATEAFYSSTLRHINFQKQKGGEAGDRYEAIKVQ
jgi:hypothetical protein